MRPGFAARAIIPNGAYAALIAFAIRVAVVKSTCDNDHERRPFLPSSSSTVRSTIAPLGVVPTVGKFLCARLLPLPAINPPVETGPCATA